MDGEYGVGDPMPTPRRGDVLVLVLVAVLVNESICAATACAACAASSPWKQSDDAAVFTNRDDENVEVEEDDDEEDDDDEFRGDGDSGGCGGDAGETAAPHGATGVVVVCAIECLKAAAMRRSDGLPDIWRS